MLVKIEAQNKRLREAIESQIAQCPMCSAGIECQDSQCFMNRAALGEGDG